jgi:very-short-patch-repair endonuclease
MTAERRAAQRLGGLQHPANLLSPAETLRRREAWKYDLLRGRLERDGRKFEFEFEVGGFVFDLALLDQRVLVEFDGAYHGGNAQREVDLAKDSAAKAHGYAIVRRTVVRSTVIDPVTIEGL